MNQRITQLAEQAGLYVDLNGRPYPKSMSAEECIAAYQKYAELIVRECLELCKYSSEEDDDDQFDLGMMCKSREIKTLIKKHFGVEE